MLNFRGGKAQDVPTDKELSEQLALKELNPFHDDMETWPCQKM